MWREVSDGYPPARRLADKHYSRKTFGATLFVGPGEKMVLLTPENDALFVWRLSVYRLDGQEGIECTLFRNEGRHLSSDLIREACLWAWQRWPGERLFSYVDTRKVQSEHPGYCFLMAGWQKCGHNKSGHLLILENTEPQTEVPGGYMEQANLFMETDWGAR